LVSQRPQKLAKDVLNLADTLFAYRTNGVLERRALAEWVQEKGADGKRDIADELPGLERGSAIVWCPVRRVYGKYQLPLKSTYDAGATPLQARAVVQTKPLDLGELKVAMGKVVDEARANDPRTLRAEIARLRAELVMASKARPDRAIEKTVPVVDPAWLAEVKDAIARLAHLKDQVVREIGKQVDHSTERLSQMVHLGAKFKPAASAPSRAAITRKLSDSPAPSRQVNAGVSSEIGHTGLRRMLVALAQRPQGLTDGQLGVRAGVSSRGGSFRTYKSKARTNGWMESAGPNNRITTAGIAALGDFEPLPEGRALAEYWLGQLGTSGASRMLRVLIDAYPNELSDEEVGTLANVETAGGSFRTYLSRLRTLELVTRGPDGLRASEELF
jgi:hypothetical protein